VPLAPPRGATANFLAVRIAAWPLRPGVVKITKLSTAVFAVSLQGRRAKKHRWASQHWHASGHKKRPAPPLPAGRAKTARSSVSPGVNGNNLRQLLPIHAAVQQDALPRAFTASSDRSPPALAGTSLLPSRVRLRHGSDEVHRRVEYADTWFARPVHNPPRRTRHPSAPTQDKTKDTKPETTRSDPPFQNGSNTLLQRALTRTPF